MTFLVQAKYLHPGFGLEDGRVIDAVFRTDYHVFVEWKTDDKGEPSANVYHPTYELEVASFPKVPWKRRRPGRPTACVTAYGGGDTFSLYISDDDDDPVGDFYGSFPCPGSHKDSLEERRNKLCFNLLIEGYVPES